MAKQSPIDELLSAAKGHKNALTPLVNYNNQKFAQGGSHLTNIQLSTAIDSILGREPPLHRSESGGSILGDIIHLPGHILSDASDQIQGFFSPWKWVPSILHKAETGDVAGLLPLIPGYTTANALIHGDFHTILTHPVGTALDVLPYLDAGLPHLANSIYGEVDSAAKVPGLDETGQVVDVPKVVQNLVTETTPAGTPISRSTRLEAAMRQGKPGSLLYNLLPGKVVDPEIGMVGRRLENFREDINTSRASNQANRDFQHTIAKHYIEPLKEIFDGWNMDMRKGFAQWWEMRGPDDTHWTDVTGAQHPVPSAFLEAAPKVEEVIKQFEKEAHGALHRIQVEGKSYLYDANSPVVKEETLLAKANKKVIDARTKAEDAKAEWINWMNGRVNRKPQDFIPNTAYTRVRYSLHKTKAAIDRAQKSLDDAIARRSQVLAKGDNKALVDIEQTIKNRTARLDKLRAQHDLLSQREMLHWHLSTSGGSVFHPSQEDYHLLSLKDAGTQLVGKRYRNRLEQLDNAKKELEKLQAQHTKTLRDNAPATFYPYIRDRVLKKVIDKYAAQHPDFADGMTQWNWDMTKKAFDERTMGKSVVEAGLFTEAEVTAMIKEVESTWQELAKEGFSPMYLSTVPRDRFKSVLDPNLFKAGALRDDPYSVRARVRDITPSGIHDPVIGLTAPALAIVRKNAIKEFYNTFLVKQVKDQAALSAWVDKEMQSMHLQPLKEGETMMSRRQDIIRQRWSVFDRKNIDPDLAQLLPSAGKIYLPKEMYDAVIKLFDPVESKLESASRVNNQGLRVFRTSIMTASLKHLAHVMFGGMTMLLLRGELDSLSPRMLQQAWEMAKNHEFPKELSAGVDFYSSEQLHDAILPMDRNTWLSKTSGTVQEFVAKIQKGEETISNFQRSLSYLVERDHIMELAKKGKSSPDLNIFENGEVKAAVERGDMEHALQLAHRGAIKHANKALIDFDGMHPAERGIIRNIFPFYAFTRHIFKSAFTYPIDYPLRAAFVYRVGSMMAQDWEQTGLPNDWMRYLTFGPTSTGDVTNVDLRFINPFRTMPDLASGGGLIGSLNPFLGFALDWAGLNPFTTSPERFGEITYNPETGYVETKRKPVSLLDFVKEFIPEVGAGAAIAGGDLQYNQLPHYAFIPGWPYHQNVNLQKAKDTLGQLAVAQQDLSTALKTGDTSALKEWNLVPFQGQLVPGKKIAEIIDNLKGSGPPKRQLGLSR